MNYPNRIQAEYIGSRPYLADPTRTVKFYRFQGPYPLTDAFVMASRIKATVAHTYAQSGDPGTALVGVLAR